MTSSDFIEVSGSSVEEAVAEALRQLGAAEEDVVIEVLSTARSGVLGLGARQARVRVRRREPEAARSTVQAPPPAPKPRRQAPSSGAPRAEKAEGRSAAKSGRRAVERTEAAAAPAPKAPQSRPKETLPAPAKAEPQRASEDSGQGDETGPEERRTLAVQEQAREAIGLLKRMLELMGESGEVTVGPSDAESFEIDIKSDGSGLLIGRHGQTLDALEYLVNRLLARRVKEPLQVIVDAESYRERRRRQLQRMALAMGEQAKREHQTVKLEPMAPRDRRVIHLALKDDPLVNTRSSGEGFMRSVEIVPVERSRPPAGGRVRRGGDRGREAPVGQQGGFKHGSKRIV